MKDVFGRDLKVGDKIAAGMTYHRSSVLRIGEVTKIKERYKPYYGYGTDPKELMGWSVRVKWTHNGDKENRYKWSNIPDSTILGDVHYTYAKVVILPDGFVEQFPPDVLQPES